MPYPCELEHPNMVDDQRNHAPSRRASGDSHITEEEVPRNATLYRALSGGSSGHTASPHKQVSDISELLKAFSPASTLSSRIPPLDEKDEREYIRFAKAMNEESLSHPSTEAQLDAYVYKVMAAAEMQCMPSRIVLHFIYRRASQYFRQIIANSCRYMPSSEEDILVMFDAVAMEMFPYSQEFEWARADLLWGAEQKDVTAAQVSFTDALKRYHRLITRRTVPFAVTNPQLKGAILNRCPQKVQDLVYQLPVWHEISLTELPSLLLRMEDGIRLKEGRNRGPKNSVNSVTRESLFPDYTASPQILASAAHNESQDMGPQTRVTNSSGSLPAKGCKWCRGTDHNSFNCVNKPRCTNCGKKGHSADTCFSFTQSSRLKDKTVSIRREGQKLLLSVDDVHNNMEALEVVYDHIGQRLAAERRTLEKSHSRNQGNGQIHQAPAHQSSPDPISRENPRPWQFQVKQEEEMGDNPPAVS